MSKSIQYSDRYKAWACLANPENEFGLTRYGFKLFRLQPGGKLPARCLKWGSSYQLIRRKGGSVVVGKLQKNHVTSPDDFEDARISDRTTYNIGGIVPKHLFVIDVDLYKEGGTELIELATEHGWDLKTITWSTARGGLQFLFRYPANDPRRLSVNAKICHSTVDIKTGSESSNGGYVVLPGSLIKRGFQYKDGTVAEEDTEYDFLNGLSPADLDPQEPPAGLWQWLLSQAQFVPPKRKARKTEPTAVPLVATGEAQAPALQSAEPPSCCDNPYCTGVHPDANFANRAIGSTGAIVPKGKTLPPNARVKLERLRTMRDGSKRWCVIRDIAKGCARYDWTEAEVVQLLKDTPKAKEAGVAWLRSQVSSQFKYVKTHGVARKSVRALTAEEEALLSELVCKVQEDRGLRQMADLHYKIQVLIEALVEVAKHAGIMDGVGCSYRRLTPKTGLRHQQISDLAKVAEEAGFLKVLNRDERDPFTGKRVTSIWQLHPEGLRALAERKRRAEMEIAMAEPLPIRVQESLDERSKPGYQTEVPCPFWYTRPLLPPVPSSSLILGTIMSEGDSQTINQYQIDTPDPPDPSPPPGPQCPDDIAERLRKAREKLSTMGSLWHTRPSA